MPHLSLSGLQVDHHGGPVKVAATLSASRELPQLFEFKLAIDKVTWPVCIERDSRMPETERRTDQLPR